MGRSVVIGCFAVTPFPARYATLFVTHEGQRYTLAVTQVTKREKMPEVVKRLLRMARIRGLKLRISLLDRGFFSTQVIDYLRRTRTPEEVKGTQCAGIKPVWNRE